MEFPVVHKNYLLTYCQEKKFACEGYEKNVGICTNLSVLH